MQYECPHCGYTWVSHINFPKCPKCKFEIISEEQMMELCKEICDELRIGK